MAVHGLIVTLSFMFVSFEWTERNVTYTISDLVSDPDFFEELVPVTYNQDKPLLPPPPPAAVNPEELNIVDNQSTETETDIAASDPTDAPVIIPTPIEVPEEVVMKMWNLWWWKRCRYFVTVMLI